MVPHDCCLPLPPSPAQPQFSYFFNQGSREDRSSPPLRDCEMVPAGTGLQVLHNFNRTVSPTALPFLQAIWKNRQPRCVALSKVLRHCSTQSEALLEPTVFFGQKMSFLFYKGDPEPKTRAELIL